MKTAIRSLRAAIIVPFLLALLEAKTLATTYTLTLQTNGSGAVSANPSLSSYPANSVVTLTATPGSNSYFAYWSGAASGTATPINVQMTGNLTVAGNFLPLPVYTLTTSTNGSGSILLNPSGGSYESNTVVTATASPASGWIFLQWSGVINSATNEVEILVDSNEDIAATFVEPATIDQGPQSASVPTGSDVTFSVQAEGTSNLIYQWSFNGNVLSSDTNTSITLTNVQLSQEGTYSILVSNSYGSATNSAVLTITNAPSGTNVVNQPTEQALLAAIQNGGTVTFGFNGTIVLSSTITVTNNIVLDGTGRAVTIDGSNSVRLFNINPGVTFSATNLTFADGFNLGATGITSNAPVPPAPGNPGLAGAFYSKNATVELTGCTVVSNSVQGGTAGQSESSPYDGIGGDGQGGAFFIDGGMLILTGDVLTANSASGAVGLVAHSSAYQNYFGGDGRGGAIYATNNASIAFINCVASNNWCWAAPGGEEMSPIWDEAFGGAFYVESGSLVVSNSLIISNAADGGASPMNVMNQCQPGAGYGGAFATMSGSISAFGCQIISNLAQGGMAERYSGTGEARGGAMFSSGLLVLSNSTLSGNAAVSGSGSDVNTDGYGGAVYNQGVAVINGCTLISNLAVGGNPGGFGVPDTTYPGGNGRGGAIFNISIMDLTNCTLTGNEGIGGAGGIYHGVSGGGFGGAICVSNGTFTAVNVTIASNFVITGPATFYPGISQGANLADFAGTLALQNSIIAYPSGSSNAVGTITDGGFNMCDDGSANFESGTSFNYTDPLLQPPANNGGPTLTMALSPDSPAVDFGTTVGAPGVDQRGYLRPSGSGVDMGAYEYQQGGNPIPVLNISTTPTGVQLSFEGQSNGVYFLQSSTTLTCWSLTNTIGPLTNTGEVIIPVNTNGPSAQFFRLGVP